MQAQSARVEKPTALVMINVLAVQRIALKKVDAVTKSEKNVNKNIYNDPRVPKQVPLTPQQIDKLANSQLKNVPSIKESNLDKKSK